MSIPVKSRAMIAGTYKDTYQDRRIADVIWEPVSPELGHRLTGTTTRLYFAHLQLDRPLRRVPIKRGKAQSAATAVKDAADMTYDGAGGGVPGSPTTVAGALDEIQGEIDALPAALIVEEEDGTPTGQPDTLKFPNGSVTDNGDGSFSIAGGSGMTNPMTTAADTIYGGASGTPTRRAGGSDGYHSVYRTATPAPAWEAVYAEIAFVIDGGGSAITTGVKGDLRIPFACAIESATLLADQSGSIVVNVWKDTLANYPPTVADKITASAPPTITSATNSTDTTLTGWTTAIAAGDTLRFNVDSAATIQRVTLALKVRRT